MSNRKRAAFIDHSFHKLTQSSAFIKEWLRNKYEITEYYDESWRGGSEPNFNLIASGDYDVVFYWQYIHPLEKLSKLKDQRIVYFPMENSLVEDWDLYWLRLMRLPIKFVCFAKKLYEKLHRFGCDCTYVQYFVNPDSLPKQRSSNNAPKVMFWQRTSAIDWDVVKRLLGNNQISTIIFRAVPDPGHRLDMPSDKDTVHYNIQVKSKYWSREDYLKELSSCDIFFAPRVREGIGMSFLEALSMGKCVIAPNCATMNEYIVSGENGYLYDLNDPQEIDLSEFARMGKEAKKRAEEGFQNMQKQRSQLLDFIESKHRSPSVIKLIKLNYLASAVVFTALFKKHIGWH